MRKFVHVCLTPALIDEFDLSEANVVVIDILRATTTMSVAFEQGAELIVPIADIEDTRAYKKYGFLIAGERQGEQIPGFDLGNSPFSFMGDAIKGARIAMTTTNGTRTIRAAQERNALNILAGSFANISAITDWLVEQNQHVCLICAGWRDYVTLEDTIFAGALARKLRHHFRRFQDTALLAETLYLSASTRKRYFMQHSSHYNRLVHLKLQNEVKYAMRRDTHPSLPLMIGDELHNILGQPDLEEFKQRMLDRQAIELAQRMVKDRAS